MQSDAQEKTRPCGTNFSDKYTQIAGGTWTLHWGSTPRVSGTCADSSNVPSYLSPHMESGMERGRQRVYFGWAGVDKGSFMSTQKAVVLEVESVFTHQEDEAKPGEVFFSLLAASNQGRAISESAGDRAGPLAARAGRFPLCVVAGFYISLFHFQCSLEELIRETTIFLLLVALNDPQDANKRETCSCLKYSCCYVIK